MRPRRAGFSYIELLISTTIVLVAYALVLGPGSYLAQSRSKSQCARNLQQLHLALALFAAEHGGALPELSGARTSDQPLSLLVPTYTADTSLFICPGSKDATLAGAEPIAGKRISYAYYMGLTKNAEPASPLASDRQVNTEAKSAGAHLFSASGAAPGNNHRKYGGNILFLDGHVETVGSVAARALAPASGSVLLNPKS